MPVGFGFDTLRLSLLASIARGRQSAHPAGRNKRRTAIMEMHQVRYFVVLCETLNFTRAAERCNVAQPSLTRAIKLLEDELGGPLFNRERNRTHLTELGRIMEPHLREALAQAAAARSQAKAFFQLKTARFKLGVARGMPLAPIDEMLGRYVASYPDTDIEIQDERLADLREALRRGDLEVVLLPQRPHDIDDLHYYPLGENRLQLVLLEGHPLTELPTVPLAEIAAYPLICSGGCLCWETAERQLRELGLEARPKVVAGSAEWLEELVAAGLGVGIGPRGPVLRTGLVSRPVAAPAAAQEVSLATKRGRLYSPPVRAFVELALRPQRVPLAPSQAVA
jgi:LysR family hydrogen peroxide-inducible transcriptional activator